MYVKVHALKCLLYALDILGPNSYIYMNIWLRDIDGGTNLSLLRVTLAEAGAQLQRPSDTEVMEVAALQLAHTMKALRVERGVWQVFSISLKQSRQDVEPNKQQKKIKCK